MPEDDEQDGVRVFVCDVGGSDEYVGFFEDDGETGYLYVSDLDRKTIVGHLQIYNNSASLEVADSDVEVLWSQDGTKCGVRIWGSMRGIIDLANGNEGRVFLGSRETPGITDSAWLTGFDTRPIEGGRTE